MSACKSYKKQIALLAARALDERGHSVLAEHLKSCPHCEAYSKQLRAVAALYIEDAERSVEISGRLNAGRVKRPAEFRFPWFKPAFGIAVLIICAAAFLLRQSPPPTVPVVRGAPASASSAPSIGNTRHLAEKDLDELLKGEMPRPSWSTEVVFAVRTRPSEN
jgi:hypothetical protein